MNITWDHFWLFVIVAILVALIACILWLDGEGDDAEIH